MGTFKERAYRIADVEGHLAAGDDVTARWLRQAGRWGKN